MDEKRVIESLSPIERNILPQLSGDFSDLKQIAEKSETDETTALRAAEFLKNKKLAEIQKTEKNNFSRTKRSKTIFRRRVFIR